MWIFVLVIIINDIETDKKTKQAKHTPGNPFSL